MRRLSKVLARLKAAPLHLRLLGGFGLLLALSAAQSVLAYQNAAENVAADAAQYRNELITSLAAETRAALLQMEAGYRGYLLVGDAGLLSSYTSGAHRLTADLAELELLSASHPDRVARWQTVERRVAAWQTDITAPGIAQHSHIATGTAEQQPPNGLSPVATSQQDITAIQQILDAAIAAEQTDLLHSHSATGATNSRLMSALQWGTLAVLVVGIATALLSARNLARAVAHGRAGQQRYREMFEGNGAIQLAVDVQTGTIIDANEAAAAFYGYARETLLKMKAGDLSERSPDEHFRDIQAIGQADRGYFVRPHRLASGELRDVEMHTSVGRDGARQLTYAIVHDITERKHAAEALKASEERFRKQYKGLPLPTYSWRQSADDFVLQDYNDAAEAVTEGTIGAWLGDRASVRFVEHPEVIASLHTCLTQQRTLKHELPYRYTVGGHERQLAFSYIFVSPDSVMVHTEDVTEIREAEQQREAMARSEKLRALGQMATGIAHDLNQSLMLVASYSDLARQALNQDPPDLAELEVLLTTTTQAALDGGETVKRLLLFTRTAPQQDAQRADLTSVVRDAAQLTAPRWRDEAQAEGRPIALYVEAACHPIIRGSPPRLRELMTNLIFNAVDALPVGGEIHLRVLVEDGQGIVEVVDSGLGMSAEVQERVFEPFFTTKGDGGSGLGLAMVFGIVEQHGGRIAIRSAAGEGATFRISFPLLGAIEDTGRVSVPSAHLAPSRPLRVLSVDDEPMMTRAVVRMLKPSGHLVSVAGSGEEALEKLAAQTFDVVVSDMGMGAGMNGWDLAEAVKRRWPDVRFLLATGWGAAVDQSEAREKGVDAVLAKPYRPEDLLQALARTDTVAA